MATGPSATAVVATVVKPAVLERRREKIPKEGPGPHGVPETYYTSRVLHSTGRYVRFVNKLRASEEVERKRQEASHQTQLDTSSNDFFIRCDRRFLINTVERRVGLCLESYEDDLNAKKARLKDLLMHEEEDNIRKFVAQAQTGAEMIWQDKRERLAFLLAKRKKEQEDKYKATPLTRCTDVLPALYRYRAKEAQEVQLYQMREKRARQASEKELDRMWHDISMKECEALEARMEFEAIERKRRDLECKVGADAVCELQRVNREKERERLKQEVLWLKSVWAEESRKDQEAARQVAESRQAAAQATLQAVGEQKAKRAQKAEDERLVGETWAGLCRAGLEAERAAVELRRIKEQELVVCNRKLLEMQRELASLDTANESVIQDVVKRNKEAEDATACEHLNRVKRNDKDCRETMLKQIEQRKLRREELRKLVLEEDAYNRQLQKQLQALVSDKERADAEKRKSHQSQLQQQIEYNRLLKERALAEEADQVRKYRLATEEYHAEVKEMLNRPFYSEHVHPFMRQMAKGLKMADKCPCSKPDHCE